MRLFVYAGALLVYAAALVALGSPWAGVAAAALSLVAVIALECTQASQRSSKAEDATDAEERMTRLEQQAEAAHNLRAAQIDTLISQVAALKRTVALNQVG